MTFEIRACRAGDGARLAAVAQATFLETYSGIVDGGDILAHNQRIHAAKAYENLLVQEDVALFLAVVDPGDAPVGYAMLSPPDLPVEIGDGDIELKRIYALHRFHGAGVGPALMSAAREAARERGGKRLLLGAYGENHRAIAFYRRNGFVQVGTRRFQVGANVYDDVVLALAL
ncbi:MAG: GNAT family N-acetyltransferase [Caulobacter sp.]|nr:GNAT family N-acetyltransferase [Caulobacter sp.]